MSEIELSRKVKDFVSSNQARWLIDEVEKALVPAVVPRLHKYLVLVVISDGQGHVMIETFITHPGAHATKPIELDRDFPEGFWKFALRTTYEQVRMTFKEER